MAKNITLMGANYPNVPAVDLPQTGGGTARFVDADDIKATDITSKFTLTLPSNVTEHSQGFKAYKAGNVIMLNFSFKITGATAGTLCRIPYSVLNAYKTKYGLDVMCDNGNYTGYTKTFISSSNIDIYPQESGTTYAIGVVTYIASYSL